MKEGISQKSLSLIEERRQKKETRMMRGKSSRSDVEISKKLNFVAAILDFWRPSWIDNGYFDKPVLYIYVNNHLYQCWYFYHKVKD